MGLTKRVLDESNQMSWWDGDVQNCSNLLFVVASWFQNNDDGVYRHFVHTLSWLYVAMEIDGPMGQKGLLHSPH